MKFGELTVKDFGEKRIIKELIKPLANDTVSIGIGDDAAMVDIPQGHKLLVSTDKIPEDLLAIQLEIMSPREHGRYLAVVNISDIVAMGGEPNSILVTAALPNSFKMNYLEEFFKGVIDGCKEYGVKLIGGDLGWATNAVFSATSIGFVKPENVIRRSTVKLGDNLFVSNEIGLFGTALVYYIIAKPKGMILSDTEEELLRSNLCLPKIPVKIVEQLVSSQACSSLIDITDGVGMSVQELSSASQTKFIINENSLPVSEITKKIAKFLEIDYLDILFGIGLDLQVMGTISSDFDNSIDGVTIIGRAIEGNKNKVVRLDNSQIEMPNKGWQHFSVDALNQVKNSIK